MASLFSHPQTPLRKQFVRTFCPTCLREVLRDGEQGARAMQTACSPDCYRRKHMYENPRNLERFGITPPFTGAPSVTRGRTQWKAK